jgi:hypothetical protein
MPGPFLIAHHAQQVQEDPANWCICFHISALSVLVFFLSRSSPATFFVLGMILMQMLRQLSA